MGKIKYIVGRVPMPKINTQEQKYKWAFKTRNTLETLGFEILDKNEGYNSLNAHVIDVAVNAIKREVAKVNERKS